MSLLASSFSIAATELPLGHDAPKQVPLGYDASTGFLPTPAKPPNSIKLLDESAIFSRNCHEFSGFREWIPKTRLPTTAIQVYEAIGDVAERSKALPC